MKPNIELLEADIAYLEAHPEEHNQATWIDECGTAYCLAGYRALKEAAAHGWRRYESAPAFHVSRGDGACIRNARSIAMEAYGLDEVQAEDLFSPLNSIDDLKSMVKDIANQAGNDA